MTYIELLLLAIGLSFDTFAVSVSGGMSLKDISFLKKIKIISSFALVQGAFLLIGWLLGGGFSKYITEWDHWIAFCILAYIGGKMVIGAVKGGDDLSGSINLLNTKKLLVLSVATSIDAVAVGISLAFIHLLVEKTIFAVAITLLITGLASYIGLYGGEKLGGKIGKKAELVGGIILILIGVRIVVEHIFF
jgi:Predicted membrane protein